MKKSMEWAKMTNRTFDKSDRDLLIRIDERLKEVQLDVDYLKKNTVSVKRHEALEVRVSLLDQHMAVNDNFRVKLGVWMTMGGVIGGLIVSVLSGFISDLIKKL